MRTRSIRWFAGLGSMLVMFSVGAGAQAPAPIGAEALEKVKKSALASKSSLLIPPGVKRAFGLPENQRIECRQIANQISQMFLASAQLSLGREIQRPQRVDESW